MEIPDKFNEPDGRRLCLVLALLFAFMSALLPAMARACGGKFANLQHYAGTYDKAGLLAEPLVNAQWRRLPAAVRVHLKRNLVVGGGIDLIGCALVMEGNAEHMGGSENAIVDVNLYSGRLSVALLSHGRIAIYAPAASSSGLGYSSLPLSIRNWAGVAASGFRARMRAPAAAHLFKY